MNRFDKNEVNAVKRVIEGGKNLSGFTSKFRGGDEVQKFEEEFARYIGVKHALSFNSGTMAIFAAFQSIIKHGRREKKWKIKNPKINLPAYTFTADPSAALLANGEVSFEDIDNIYFDYEEIDFSIPEDISTDFEDVFIEEEFFEEEFETIFLEEFNDFEEFEEAAFEELEVPEEFESFFSEEFTDEEMEIIEEEFADEFTDEIMDEVVEDEPTELAATKEEEIIEEAANEEKEVASKEEETKEEIIEEKDNEQIAEEKTETEILKEDKEVEVAETKDNKINIEVNDNVSVVVKEISLFDNGNQLAAYDNTDFYQPETIYADVDSALFIQADLSIYNKGIYLNIGLDNYISTDPVGQHEQKLYEIKVNKIQLMIELQKLKELL